MTSKQTGAFALGVLALLIALAVPAAITATDTPDRASFDLTEGDTVTVTQTLQVTLDTAQDPDATVTLRDEKSLDSETQTISEGNTSEFTIDNESINVTVLEVSSNQDAQLSVEYPRTYGWNESARVFVDNLPFMLVVAFSLVLIGAVATFKP